MSTLTDPVQEWLRLDKNEGTRSEVEKLLQQRNSDELVRRMTPRIEFGTAGLRGRMEAGWARMNDLTVIQASQGLCAYVKQVIPDAASRGVVIGHDHRHNSERFAALAAAAFIHEGVKVYLHRGLVHTPIVPFSVSHLKAACGVMITASHNPKDDNGYKVYWENAVQIIGPHDTGIARAIEANLEPRTWDIDAALTSPLCVDRTRDMIDAYHVYLTGLTTSSRFDGTKAEAKFVNTSMHGVSHPFVTRAFEFCGFPRFSSVEVQREPDPDFPTVKFPNPEEKGALDLAKAYADEIGVSFILAQDPDADRFAAAEKVNGVWRVFTGDQLGTLFAAHIVEAYKAIGKLDKLALVASTVSSKMLAAMAKVEGFHFEDCLTGFKFIGNTALALESKGYAVPFGYEEAIGYMFGDRVRDKDGVAATVKFVELVLSLQERGLTPSSYLEQLYQRYGYFQTSNSYFICREPQTIDAIFARLRNWPSQGFKTSKDQTYPAGLAGMNVTRVRDLTVGYDSAGVAPDYAPTLPLSSGHMVQFTVAGGESSVFLTIRTSGTEPKIKYYLEGQGDNPTQVQELLARVVGELKKDWMEADRNSLNIP